MTARGIGAMISGGTTESGRRQDDFYPTPWEATAALIEAEGDRLRDALIWEPACGDGAMGRELERGGLQVVAATDLVSRGYGIGGCNFLTTHDPDGRSNAIITNPPFALAADFIRRALIELRFPYVAMLLKSQYWHADERVGLFERVPPTAWLPLAWRLDFTGGGNPTMDCAWAVWDAREAGRQRFRPLRKPTRVTAAVADLFEIGATA